MSGSYILCALTYAVLSLWKLLIPPLLFLFPIGEGFKYVPNPTPTGHPCFLTIVVCLTFFLFLFCYSTLVYLLKVATTPLVLGHNITKPTIPLHLAHVLHSTDFSSVSLVCTDASPTPRILLDFFS